MVHLVISYVHLAGCLDTVACICTSGYELVILLRLFCVGGGDGANCLKVRGNDDKCRLSKIGICGTDLYLGWAIQLAIVAFGDSLWSLQLQLQP
ncbi:hypothetical protein Hdeb2414_s0011g00359891 [Helianthus debilis subsp. tardiflorus]